MRNGFFLIYFREGVGERERERNRLGVPLTDALIGWFVHVPWPGMEPAALVYQDDTPTNWATAGASLLFF